MKTINGNNKTERNINKLKKYFNLDLVVNPNGKKAKIKGNIDDIYAIIKPHVKVVKNGNLLVLEPQNANGKVYYVKPYFAFTNAKKQFVFFKPFKDSDKAELAQLARGFDDVYKMSELEEFTLKFDPKNIFVSTLIANGKLW